MMNTEMTPLMKAIMRLEDVLIKAKRMPIGTVSKGRKKIAEGKWVKVKENRPTIQQKPKNQTETKEFKEWFGDSKVVDENGKPLVVYHGTNKDFNVFDKGEFGYHVGSRKAAEDINKKIHGNIIKDLYVKIENPIELDDLGNFTPLNIVRNMRKRNISNGVLDSQINQIENDPKYDIFSEGYLDQYYYEKKAKQYDVLMKYFKDNNIDGIKYRNETEDAGHTSFVAFEPTQIKSATGNQGTFDPNNPDMTKARKI